MAASERNTRAFFLDRNVFVAATKDLRKETRTLRLLLDLLGRDDGQLVGHDLWVEEMLRHAEGFHSETATWLISSLLNRTRLVRVETSYRAACARFVTTPDPADILHAATCLQERAILISNDRHYDRIRDEGINEG